MGTKRWPVPCIAVLLLMLASIQAAQASAPAPDADAARYEIDFMSGMIDHHAMAVEMASLCLERATHPELIEMCQSIKSAQTAEIARMQGWLDQWYDTEHKPKMTRAQRTQLRNLAALSGAEFEIAFMRQMIEHHQMALHEAATCLTETYHQELIGLCGSIASAQAQEIVTLRQWLCQWYGECLFTAASRSQPEQSFG